MLSKIIVHVCARCGSERLRKNGHAENGSQRAKCRECERTFVLEPKGPRHTKKFKEAVVAAYQERTSIRSITRTFGVFYQTIIKWAGGKMESLPPPLEDTLLPSQAGDVLELDELWSRVGAKWQECWLWVALCRRTRQIVAYTLGDRSQESARWLRETIPRGLHPPCHSQ